MQAFHTEEDPPYQGRIILAMTGCIWKSKKAPRNTAIPKKIMDRSYYSLYASGRQDDSFAEEDRIVPKLSAMHLQ
jgi:hypothetical protein